MNKRGMLALCLAVAVGGSQALSADAAKSEDLDIFTYLYEAAVSTTDKLGILHSVRSMNIPGVGMLYAKAISQLVRDYPDINRRGNATEREEAEELALLLADVIGNEKQTSSAADLWRVVTQFPNPLVKSEAMMALGKMRARQFLPQIARTLEDLNTRAPTDRLAGERIAFGAILALEKYQDPDGYLPVFFASKAWYNDRVKKTAADALPVILADPTNKMGEVIGGGGYPPATKLVALQFVDTSSVPNSSKAKIAAQALDAGWKIPAGGNANMQKDVAQLRKNAMNMIAKYKATDANIYDNLGKSFAGGIDLQERLGAVNTLKTLNTPQSVNKLNEWLMAIHKAKGDGSSFTPNNPQMDESLIRGVITALGDVGNNTSKVQLGMVASSPAWGSGVTAAAKDAQAKIK